MLQNNPQTHTQMINDEQFWGAFDMQTKGPIDKKKKYTTPPITDKSILLPKPWSP